VLLNREELGVSVAIFVPPLKVTVAATGFPELSLRKKVALFREEAVIVVLKVAVIAVVTNTLV